jgi:hypothetical protein
VYPRGKSDEGLEGAHESVVVPWKKVNLQIWRKTLGAECNTGTCFGSYWFALGRVTQAECRLSLSPQMSSVRYKKCQAAERSGCEVSLQTKIKQTHQYFTDEYHKSPGRGCNG